MIRKLCLCLSFILFSTTLFAQLNLDWATYYGNWTMGPGTVILGSAFDAKSGYLYITGSSSDSSGIATPGSYKDTFVPYPITNFGDTLYNTDLFLAKFDTLGNRIWATYLGGAHVDYGSSIAIDTNGNIFIGGASRSSNGIATPNSFYPYNTYGYERPFLTKFNSNGIVLWSTFYGGIPDPLFTSITTISSPSVVVDKENNVYIGGATSDPTNIATTGSYQEIKSPNPTSTIENFDGYIIKFSNNGQKLWGTYYGGLGNESINSLYIDQYNNLYCAGLTWSDNNIASPGAEQATKNQQADMFIAKFNSTGQRLWATYSGGEKVEGAFSIIGKENEDAIYISGFTNSTTGIADSNAYQSAFNGGNFDGLLMKYTLDGHKVWGTYYGGENTDLYTYPTNLKMYPSQSRELGFDHQGNLIFIGNTASLNHLKKGCFDLSTHNNSFLSKWNTEDGQLIWAGYYDVNLWSITAFGNGNSFIITGQTKYDSLATPLSLQATKVPDQISGIMAKFSGEICPLIDFPITQNGNMLSVDSGYAVYQWLKDGIIIPGADSSTLEIGADSSIYLVHIQDACGCTYTSDKYHYPPLGIYKINQSNLDITVFPNPSLGKFMVKGKLESNQTVSFSIINVLGKEVASGHISVNNFIVNKSMDFANLKLGIYYIRFNQGNNQKVLKIVIEGI